MEKYYHSLIIGGESGNDNGEHRYRPCQLEWLEHLVEVGKQTQTPVFVKQLGTYLSKDFGLVRHARDIKEFPENLRIQKFPDATPPEIHDRMG